MTREFPVRRAGWRAAAAFPPMALALTLARLSTITLALSVTPPASAQQTPSIGADGVPVEELLGDDAFPAPQAPTPNPSPAEAPAAESPAEAATSSSAPAPQTDQGSSQEAAEATAPEAAAEAATQTGPATAPQTAPAPTAEASGAPSPQPAQNTAAAAADAQAAPTTSAAPGPALGEGALPPSYDPRAAADPSRPSPPDGITSLKLAKADRVYDLAFPRGQIEWMMRSVAPSLVEALRIESARVGAPVPPDLDARVQAIVAEEMLGLENDMRPAIVPIYAVELTEPELDELLKLYSSEEGRSMMQKMQIISGAVANEMRLVIDRFNNRIGDRIETELLTTPQ